MEGWVRIQINSGWMIPVTFTNVLIYSTVTTAATAVTVSWHALSKPYTFVSYNRNKTQAHVETHPVKKVSQGASVKERGWTFICMCFSSIKKKKKEHIEWGLRGLGEGQEQAICRIHKGLKTQQRSSSEWKEGHRGRTVMSDLSERWP